MGKIYPIVMPKWGLAMQEGMVAQWNVAEGDKLTTGEEFMDIETTKIANAFESPFSGLLRRIVVKDGETVSVGALIGVVSEGDVGDDEIDAFIAEFQANFVPPEENAEEETRPEHVDIGAGRHIQHISAGPGHAPDGVIPVLFIHGFGADHTGWMFNQAKIAAERRTYAVDLPGHGGSTKDVGSGDVTSLAGDMLAFMDAAGIDVAHFVGHSLGGAVALYIAKLAEHRTKSLCLVAPAGLGAEINKAFIDGFISQKRARKLRRVLETLVVDPQMITADMTEQILRFKRLDGADEALRTLAGGCFPGGQQTCDLRAVLRGLNVPVSLIWGEQDAILPMAHADGMSEAVTVVKLTETGHLPHMERANTVNEWLRERIAAAEA